LGQATDERLKGETTMSASTDLKPLGLVAALMASAFAASACTPQGSRPAPAASAQPVAEAGEPASVPSTAPAGVYTLDKAHTSVNFRVSHMGFSRYTARFGKVDGKIAFDPDHPEKISVTAEIDPASLLTNYPFHDPGYPMSDVDFDKILEGKDLFDVARYRTMSFRSTKVEPTGARTARVTGDLTMHGVTRPVVLDVSFNGGYAPGAIDPMGARIGFSAHGFLERSDFGMGFGVPAKGTNMGVGDKVEILIETEATMKK
jgi:polyisoprenoid-binding protein YceI